MCEEHLKNSEIAYVELSELYNWKHINCISDDNIRSVEDINEEIVECIKEYL